MEVPTKPAASILLYYVDGDDYRFLMGRRSDAHKFMPGVYVFPGGKVDADDYVASANTPHIDIQQNLKLDGLPVSVQAFATAALRELDEETGYGFDKNSPLKLFERAITPNYYSMRYDTLFFIAKVKPLQSEQPIASSAELENVGWYTKQEMDRLPIAGITQYILQQGLAAL